MLCMIVIVLAYLDDAVCDSLNGVIFGEGDIYELGSGIGASWKH